MPAARFYFATPGSIFVAPVTRSPLDDGMLSLCQHGYESLLERELGEAGLTVAEKGPGWARCGGLDLGGDKSPASTLPQLPELAFAHLTLLSPREIKGESVNALAQQLADYFFESLRGE